MQDSHLLPGYSEHGKESKPPANLGRRFDGSPTPDLRSIFACHYPRRRSSCRLRFRRLTFTRPTYPSERLHPRNFASVADERTFLESLTSLTLIADCSAKDQAGIEPANSKPQRQQKQSAVFVFRVTTSQPMPPILVRSVWVAWTMPPVCKTLSTLARNRQHNFGWFFRLYCNAIRNPNENQGKNNLENFGCIAEFVLTN